VKIQKPDELVSSSRKILIYGPTGHGKTRFLGTAQDDPRTAPILILDFEGGVASLVGRDIDVVRVRSWEDYREVHEYLRGGTSYRSIGIDSITETHLFSLLHLLETEDRRDPDLLREGDYGKALVQMRRFLRAFRDLPYHVFFTASSREEVESRDGLVKKPALVGRLADEVAGMVEVVAYLALAETEEGTRRVLLLQNQPKIRVKVRTPWGQSVPDLIWDPTVSLLFDALEGGVKSDEDSG